MRPLRLLTSLFCLAAAVGLGGFSEIHDTNSVGQVSSPYPTLRAFQGDTISYYIHLPEGVPTNTYPVWEVVEKNDPALSRIIKTGTVVNSTTVLFSASPAETRLPFSETMRTYLSYARAYRQSGGSNAFVAVLSYRNLEMTRTPGSGQAYVPLGPGKQLAPWDVTVQAPGQWPWMLKGSTDASEYAWGWTSNEYARGDWLLDISNRLYEVESNPPSGGSGSSTNLAELSNSVLAVEADIADLQARPVLSNGAARVNGVPLTNGAEIVVSGGDTYITNITVVVTTNIYQTVTNVDQSVNNTYVVTTNYFTTVVTNIQILSAGPTNIQGISAGTVTFVAVKSWTNHVHMTNNVVYVYGGVPDGTPGVEQSARWNGTNWYAGSVGGVGDLPFGTNWTVYGGTNWTECYPITNVFVVPGPGWIFLWGAAGGGYASSGCLLYGHIDDEAGTLLDVVLARTGSYSTPTDYEGQPGGGDGWYNGVTNTYRGAGYSRVSTHGAAHDDLDETYLIASGGGSSPYNAVPGAPGGTIWYGTFDGSHYQNGQFYDARGAWNRDGNIYSTNHVAGSNEVASAMGGRYFAGDATSNGFTRSGNAYVGGSGAGFMGGSGAAFSGVVTSSYASGASGTSWANSNKISYVQAFRGNPDLFAWPPGADFPWYPAGAGHATYYSYDSIGNAGFAFIKDDE